MGILRYSSNNSGGNWWLTDKDWKALSDAGWVVHWGDSQYGYEKLLTSQEEKGDRFLGALAMSCAKEFSNANVGISEWETITTESSNANGCPCCGPPHSFEFYEDKDNSEYIDNSDPYEEGEW